MKTSTTSKTVSRNFFKAAVLALLAVCFTVSLKAQYAQQWSVSQNAEFSIYERTNVIKDAANNFYTFGGKKLAKYAPGGGNVWTKTITSKMETMTIDNSGNIYVAGTFDTASFNRLFFKKFDNNGTELMSKVYNSGSNFSPVDIILDNAGSVYILSRYSINGTYHSNSASLIKFDNVGNMVWVVSPSGTGPSKMIKDQAGNLIAASYTSSYYGSFATYSTICKYSQSGNVIQSHTIDSCGISDMFIDNSGNLYAAGNRTIKLNSNMQREWMYVNGFYSASVKADNTGNVILSGSSTYGYLSDAITAKLNSSGQLMWQYQYNGLAGGEDAAYELQILPNGTILVCGTTERSSGNLDFFLFKLSQSGSLIHSNFYNSAGGNNDEAKCMKIVGTSDVILCGISGPTYNRNEVILIKFADVTGINTTNGEIPESFNLSQNYPNPFNPSTKISFSIPKSSMVKIVVYDAAGREVETLVNEQLNAGTFEVDFNASKLTSGVYFYKMVTDGFTNVKKMILVK